MARVKKAFLNQFHTLSMEDLEHPVLFVVDMIDGFIKEGALHDEAIMDIVPSIIDIVKERELDTIFVADAHPSKTREFLSYPSHCVIGTKESNVIDELVPYIDELFHKNSTNTFTSVDFQKFLDERLKNYKEIILTGCCTDICILQFALCLNAWLNEHNRCEHTIIIPIDCVDTYHIEGLHDCVSTNEFALANMQANGIHIVSSLKRGE